MNSQIKTCTEITKFFGGIALVKQEHTKKGLVQIDFQMKFSVNVNVNM